MRVFVTGTTGFIGGALAQALVARGDDVVSGVLLSWAKHDTAISELGYGPRSLAQGLRDTLAAEGRLPAAAAA